MTRRSAAAPANVVVLGGDSDIGRATVERLARGGSIRRVVLAVRSPEKLTPLGLPPSAQLDVCRWDALDVAGHESFADELVALTGGVDMVLCAVGALGHHAGLSMGAEDVDAMFRTNTSGPAAMLGALARRMADRGSGTIVVLSSVAGVRPRRSNYVYGASKAGLDALARGLADAVADRGVDVLVVRPGFVRSSMTEGLDPAPFATDPERVAAAIQSRLGRRPNGVLWVPSVLRAVFAVLSALPTSWWRRVSGNR